MRINGHGHILPEPFQIPKFMKEKRLFWVDNDKKFMRQGGWSRPIITNDNMVIASKDGYLHKINLDNGFYNPNWKYPRDEDLGAIYGSITLYENIIYGSSYSCRGGDCSGKVFGVNEDDVIFTHS